MALVLHTSRGETEALKIETLQPDAAAAIAAIAAMLTDAFPDAWDDLAAAENEVRASFAPDRISRVARNDDGAVLGWIGGIRQYDGHVWELHPLVVRADRRGHGIGRALVQDFEKHVRERGGFTIWLGTDDEYDQTSLSGVDLYPDVWRHVQAIRNLRRHPFEFYARLGYVIVGVMPDANGRGRPDIYMAKRVGD